MAKDDNYIDDEEMREMLSYPQVERLPKPEQPGPEDTRGELERILGRTSQQVGVEFQDPSGVKRVVASPPEAEEQKVIEVGKRVGRPHKHNTVAVREKLMREANPVLFEREFSQTRHYRNPVNKDPNDPDPLLCDECKCGHLFFVDPTNTRYRDVRAQYMSIGMIHIRIALCRNCHKLHIMVFE